MVLRMKEFVKRSFPDELQVGTIGDSGWGSAPGSETYTYDTVNVVSCKLDEGQTQSSFETKDGGETEFGDGVIIISVDNTSITMQSRIKLVKRNRLSLSTKPTFRIVGINQTDSAKLVFVKRISGNVTR